MNSRSEFLSISEFHSHAQNFERGTKARLSFSGGLHAPVNMADSMVEVNVGGKNAGNGTFAALYCAIAVFVSQVFVNPEVLRDFHRLFGSRKSNYRHSPYYPPCLQAREAKSHFDAALERSAHDCEIRLFSARKLPTYTQSTQIVDIFFGLVLSLKLQILRKWDSLIAKGFIFEVSS